ncbi:MAG: hypothetical protein ACYCV7_04900 [Acidimicrobiales bacterium]
MDDQLAFLQKVTGSVEAEDQPAVRILSGIFNSKSMVNGMKAVLVGDLMVVCRLVDLHLLSVLRKQRSRETVSFGSGLHR